MSLVLNLMQMLSYSCLYLATNETMKHVTYLIEIEKNGKRLLIDTFHSHTGNLGIKMRPSGAEQITINCEQDPILASYTGDMDHPVSATGPIFAEGGLSLYCYYRNT